MLQTMDEVKKADLSTGQMINGVDNANLMSVDSTEPFKTKVDVVVSDEEKEVSPEGEVKVEAKEVKEETPTSTPATEVKPDEPVTEPVKEVTDDKGSFEKRIGKLTKKYRTAERERDYEREKRAEVEKELKKLKLAVPATDKPNVEDYEDTPSFLEALTDWKVEQKLRIQQDDTVKETTEVRDREAVAEIEETLDAIGDRGREKYDDYETLVFDKDLSLTQGMIETIILSDIAEEILYYLGQHPDQAMLLSEMTVLKAAKEIGKLEVELSAAIPKPSVSSDGTVNPDDKTVKVTPIKKKTTKTPEPIETVKATGTTDKDPAKMSPKEYRAWRERNKE